MSTDRYELIDFGDGRKLESLAGYLIDRPCPAAQHLKPRDRSNWSQALARYDPQAKTWCYASSKGTEPSWPPNLDLDCGTFRMPVRLTPYGHIGVFPEQADNWRWLSQPRNRQESSESAAATQPAEALNLFGYTGASTLALVVAGYRVAHVDAARPNVHALRIAAEHNGRPDAPIRYIVDDAAKFTAREVRRNRKYHTIVLDPPAYGHAPSGKAWRLERDLWPLLEDCLTLLDPSDFRLLITGHSPEVDARDIREFLEQTEFLSRAEGDCGLLIESGRSQLRDTTGRPLDAGFYVRAQSRST